MSDVDLKGTVSNWVELVPIFIPTVLNNLTVTSPILLFLPWELPIADPASILKVSNLLEKDNPMCAFVTERSKAIAPELTTLSACAAPSAKIETVCPSK